MNSSCPHILCLSLKKINDL
uniref:Uncharacterized protein n=1 Tax=Anguilla anguilla TaxID=7936 RepID=A0A0E9Q5Z6_ANGAN